MTIKMKWIFTYRWSRTSSIFLVLPNERSHQCHSRSVITLDTVIVITQQFYWQWSKMYKWVWTLREMLWSCGRCSGSEGTLITANSFLNLSHSEDAYKIDHKWHVTWHPATLEATFSRWQDLYWMLFAKPLIIVSFFFFSQQGPILLKFSLCATPAV